MTKPKITIDNFQRMGEGATFWLQSFDTYKLGPKNILRTDWLTVQFLDDDDTHGTGFSDLNIVTSFAKTVTNDVDHILAFDSNEIFDIHPVVASSSKGDLHSVAPSGSGVNQVLASQFGEILTTKEEHVLYTSSHHLGIGWRGTCKAGSGTTKIVDADGRDFSATLGVLNTGSGSTVSSKFVYNLDNEEVYEITSITTTDATNDTLNFSAGTANNTDDEFIVFVDNGWDGSDNYEFNVEHILGNHFAGQDQPNSWRREIVLFGDDYIILNGNYLATLNENLTTWSETGKQLPAQHHAVCCAVNNDKLIVGANYKGRGVLLLWDGYTSGWLSILNLDEVPYAITEYDNGWLFMLGGRLMFTNGYQMKELSVIPDSESYGNKISMFSSGLQVVSDKVFVASNIFGSNRLRMGIYIYDINKGGWSFVPPHTKDGDNSVDSSSWRSALFPYYSGTSIRLFHSESDSINYLINSASEGQDSFATFFIQLPYKMRISNVEISAAYSHSEYIASISGSPTTDIYLSYGDGRRGMWRDTQCSTPASSTTLTNSQGNIYPAYVGQQILVTDNSNTATSGDVSWITAIANGGTTSELWTLDPALSTTFTGSADVLVADLYKAGKQTITFDTDINFLQNLNYPISDFYSDKLYLQVYITSSGTQYPMDIHAIRIY